jgi:histidinol-phosphate aminotransferase
MTEEQSARRPLMESYFRNHIVNLTPYSSARDEYTGKEGIFLDANENPYSSVNGEAWNRYPDPYQWAIKHKLAPIKGVRAEQIFLGNGSDEPIDLLIRAACEPQKDSILIMPPTYGMYQVSADVNNVPVIKVPLTPDFQIDVEAVLKAIEPHTKIIWICSPNNPTGNLLGHNAILQIVESFNGLVVVDEAYIDFATERQLPESLELSGSSSKLSGSFLAELDHHPNLVVLQTFSKAWGLAGLRLGMCFASEDIIKILNKIKPPYNLSAPTQQLLFEMLNHEEEKNKMVAQILAEREKLKDDLLKLAIVKHIYSSDSNMLLVRFDDAAAVMQYLIEQKIIVRDRSKVMLCEGCLRITIGTELENNALIAVLKNLEQHE